VFATLNIFIRCSKNYKKHCITPKPNIHDQHKQPTSSARRSTRLGIKNCLFSIINTAGFAIQTHPVQESVINTVLMNLPALENHYYCLKWPTVKKKQSATS
jgi:hypothetical protein